jgi:hypothetical protein
MFLFCIVSCGMLPQSNAGPPEAADTADSALHALRPLNGVIGEWRGTGQLKRGSAQGAWREDGRFVWDFTNGQPAICYKVTDGKFIREGRITWNRDTKQVELRLTTAEGSDQQYAGTWNQARLELVSQADPEGISHRLTITPLNEKRTLVLLERTSPHAKTFFRVAEIGYTREGTHLAVEGGGRPECVVTGGSGTIPVTYKGETYYVCCTGCRQAFQDDPETILSEFRERLKQRQNEK